jgi:flavodoxin
MAFKYKLKEAPEGPNLASQIGAKIGDISYSKDGKTKFIVNKIDPETGRVEWKVINLPAFEKLNDNANDLVTTAKGVYTKTKEDEKFREFYEEARLLRNKIRQHLRSEYPDEYKRITMEGEVEEISTSGAAGSYLTKYAFKKPKKQEKLPEGIGATLGPGLKATENGVKDNYYVKKFGYKLVPKDKNGNYVQKGSGLEVKNF